MTRAGIREETGIVAQRAADRKRWERYAYKAPVILTDESPGDAPPAVVAKRAMEALAAATKAATAKLEPEVAEVRAAPTRPSLRTLLELASRVTGADYHEILGPRRARDIAWPRHFAFWLVKTRRPDLSLVTIGKAFGRDHTTVLAGLKRFEERRNAPPVAGWIEQLPGAA